MDALKRNPIYNKKVEDSDEAPPTEDDISTQVRSGFLTYEADATDASTKTLIRASFYFVEGNIMQISAKMDKTTCKRLYIRRNKNGNNLYGE